MIIRVYIESININKLGNIEYTHIQCNTKNLKKIRATQEDKKYQNQKQKNN